MHDPTLEETIAELRENATSFDAKMPVEGFNRAIESVQYTAQRPWFDLEAQLQRGEASDGHHTHNELYAYRLAYNALYFNMLAWQGQGDVSKSWRHHDGEPCFGVTEEGNRWFIVTADIFGGQVSNHYREKHWDLFKVPEVEAAPEWDGHTPEVALERLLSTAREIGW